MRFEQWVLPPAIAAAVFTTVAIVPPGGGAPRGLRVEALGPPVDGAPYLLRVAVDQAGSPSWHPPRDVEVTVSDASGRALGDRFFVHRVAGVPYVFASIPANVSNAGRVTLRAEGLSADVSLPSRRVGTNARPVAMIAPGPGGIDVVVEGGSLVPDVPGVVLVRADGGAAEVAMAATDDALHIGASRAPFDRCGVARFDVTLNGLDAHVVATVNGTGAPRVARRRLAVQQGGLSLVQTGSAVTVRAASGGQPVFALGGDESAELGWSAARLEDAADGMGRVEIVPPAGAHWIIVSLSPVFEQAVGLWLSRPPVAGCSDTQLGERFLRATASIPARIDVRLLYDGAEQAGIARAARQLRARYASLALAGIAILFLVGLVIAASLERDPRGIESFAVPTRQRLIVAIGGSAALLVGGFVLLTTFILRT